MSFYYVHVVYKGERMGSEMGIPCRTASEAQGLVDQYVKRGCKAWFTTPKGEHAA